MPTPEQLSHWFGFAASPLADKAKHVAIRDAETVCVEAVSKAITDGDFLAVTTATFAFATVINVMAPESPDKTAAIRCVRIARKAASEAVMYGRKANDPANAGDGSAFSFSPAAQYRVAANQCGGFALQNLTSARYQASDSIELGGK